MRMGAGVESIKASPWPHGEGEGGSRLQTNLMKLCEGEGVYPAEQLKGVYSQRSRFPTFVVVFKKTK